MTVAELPTGNYTLLILAVVFCLMYVIFCLYAFVLDEEELKEVSMEISIFYFVLYLVLSKLKSVLLAEVELAKPD